MKRYTVSSSALINAPATQVYAILADYRDGHPQILPKPFFQSLHVEQGGIGAGTRIRVQTRAFGRTQTFWADITEPEPGRVLVESDQANGLVTTFTVEPRAEWRHAQVTFTTEMNSRARVLGPLERFLTTIFLRRVYKQEMAQLAALATRRAHSDTYASI